MDQEGQTAQSTLTFPAELESFLPASLWQMLTAVDDTARPRRGVLLNALDRLRSILYQLSTFLPSHLAQEQMRRPAPGTTRGQRLQGSLLFADVSGFTALSERLSVLEDGAEQLTGLMNSYFDRMLKILGWSGGILLKFAGDALLVYFPEQQDGGNARWAVRAGQRMMEAMADFDAVETSESEQVTSLSMKIGIGTGHFLAASIGNSQRMEYVILGPTVARTMQAEGTARPGQVIADRATITHLETACSRELSEGFYPIECEPGQDLDEFEIKAEVRRPRGAMPWSASPRAIFVQMEVALRQIQALSPYLPTELVERIVAQAQRRQVESEFRPTTVLFVNLTGLESLLDSWGSDGVSPVTHLLDEYFRAMHEVITRHGGIVSRIDPYSQGSKMLVLFGAPVAHEDDPQRAVSAALAMNDKLVELNGRWRPKLADRLPADHAGPLIQQHMGITLGLTFAGLVGSSTRREYTVMGDDVNLAARLMSAAQPGQILISQHVYDAVVDHFVAIALRPIQVKGKRLPIPIYEPQEPHDDPLARRLRSRDPLLGRDAELDRLLAIVRQVQAGRGTLLAIRGAAGVGKSHLADHLASYALDQEIEVLFSACRSFGADAPYSAWSPILQSLIGLLAAGDAAGHREQSGTRDTPSSIPRELIEADPLAALMRLLDAAPAATPGDSPAAVPVSPAPTEKMAIFATLEQRAATPKKEGLNLWQLVRERPQIRKAGERRAGQGAMWQNLQKRVTARQQERLFAAVGNLLEQGAAGGPLLLLFENAQWLDPASRELLDYLGTQLAGLPVLVLLVERAEEGAEAATSSTTAFTLGPLSPEGTTALAMRVLGCETLAPNLAQAIYEQSGGNPLFIKEIAGWMQRTGRETLDDLQNRGSGLQASALLQELLLSHLDSLPPGPREVARIGSVVGSEFLQDEIRTLAPSHTDDAQLDRDLAELEMAKLILLADGGSRRRYAFRQMLTREVVYNSQSFARRRELHAALAAYLESQHTGSVARHCEYLVQHAERLAYHHERAGQPLPAARYLLLCGHKAQQRYGYPQARGYYQRALAALDRQAAEEPAPGMDGTSAGLLKALAHEAVGDVAMLMGDFAPAASAYEAAFAQPGASAGSAGNGTRAGLLLKLALALPLLGRADEAQALARQAWTASGEGDRPGAPVRQALAAAAVLAWLHSRADDGQAIQWIERARHLPAPESDPWSAGVTALLADLAGDWTAAREDYLALDRPVGAALAACRQGDRYLQGAPGEATAAYERAAELWGQENDAYGLALALYRRAEALYRDQALAKARTALQEAQALLTTATSAPLASEQQAEGAYQRSSEQEDRQAILRALAILEESELEPDAHGSWPPWRWQFYDDAFRISILFEPEARPVACYVEQVVSPSIQSTGTKDEKRRTR